MTETSRLLDVAQVRELFDLRSSYAARMGGGFTADPYPAWARLREQAPVHEGVPHEMLGLTDTMYFQGLPYPERKHFTAFSYEACDTIYRDPGLFASSPEAIDLDAGHAVTNSMLSMGGSQHRRYRALVQPSFVPAKARWWIENWIKETVQLLIDTFVDDGRAELNVDFCAAIPVLTITSSFGIPIEKALDVRAVMMEQPEKVVQILAPIVAARREQPEDDLISILVEAEIKDEDGVLHRLSDAEIYSFSLLLLAAGSGTTWKQMGITLTALLQRPQMLTAVQEDRALLRPAVEESLRWMPTDPIFARWTTRDADFYDVHVPAGSVMHVALGAANRDPLRWEKPDEYDIGRPPRASMAFGSGAHICLGMHVARAEMHTGINALLDRLPNLRLDPDAEPPRFVGFYERGATAIPVLFD